MKKKSKIKSIKDRSATHERYTSGANMAKIPGLIRRGGTYSLRRRVPADLVAALGRKEVWLALGTSDFRAAVKEARLASARLDIQWQQQREALARGERIGPDNTVSEDALRRAVVATFWRKEQGAALQSTAIDRGMFESIEHEVGGLETRDPSAEAALFVQASALIRERKLDIEVPVKAEMGKRAPPFVASPELLRLIDLLRRADVEHLKRMLDRLDGQHGDNAYDPLFSGVNSVSAAPSLTDGITLGEAIQRMENDPTRAHLGDTADAKYVMTFRAMKEVIGVDRKLVSITRAECAVVQELIAGIPANVAKLKSYARLNTMQEIAALALSRGDRLMSPGTVRVYTHTQSAFFNWCIRKGLLTLNPATRLAPAKGAAEVSRRPFTVDELNRIIMGLSVGFQAELSRLGA